MSKQASQGPVFVVLGVSVALLVMLIMGAGMAFFLLAKAEDNPGLAADSGLTSPFEDASGLQPAFAGAIDGDWLGSAGKLTLSPRSVELVLQRDGIARRYTVSPKGTVMRRGGAGLVDAEPFDLRELDLELVPRLVADARERTGVDIAQVVVGRDEEALLLWRLVPAGEASDVYYLADGSFVPDPDNP